MDQANQWYLKKTAEVFDILQTNPNGLDNEDVVRRQALYGPNQIHIPYKINPLFIFLKQFKDFLITGDFTRIPHTGDVYLGGELACGCCPGGPSCSRHQCLGHRCPEDGQKEGHCWNGWHP